MLSKSMIALVLILTSAVACAQDVPKVISVTGSATVSATPDVADITAGVETFAASPTEAKAEADKTSNAILDAIRKAGIPAADIQASQISANMVYKRDSQRIVEGFTASRHFAITVHDLRKAGPVYDAAVAAGANVLSGPSFRSSESRKFKDQARRMAVDAAREKARLLASQAGVGVGPVRKIEEGSVPEWSNAGSNAYGYGAGAGIGGGDNDDERTPVPPGQIEIRAQVLVIFELRQ